MRWKMRSKKPKSPMPIEVRQQAIIVRLVYIVELCVAEGLLYSSGRRLVVWGRASDERGKEKRRGRVVVFGRIDQPTRHEPSTIRTLYYKYPYTDWTRVTVFN